MTGQVVACQDSAREVLRLPSSYFRDTLSRARCISVCCKSWFIKVICCARGARQLYDLSRQALFAIWIERAWKEYASLSSGSVVGSGCEIWIGKCQIRIEVWWQCPQLDGRPDGWDNLRPTWAAREAKGAGWATRVGCLAGVGCWGKQAGTWEWPARWEQVGPREWAARREQAGPRKWAAWREQARPRE